MPKSLFRTNRCHFARRTGRQQPEVWYFGPGPPHGDSKAGPGGHCAEKFLHANGPRCRQAASRGLAFRPLGPTGGSKARPRGHCAEKFLHANEPRELFYSRSDVCLRFLLRTLTSFVLGRVPSRCFAQGESAHDPGTIFGCGVCWFWFVGLCLLVRVCWFVFVWVPIRPLFE